jgi:hypothetical protein
MGLNIGGAIAGGLTGLAEGLNPISGIAGAVAGAFSGKGPSGAGNIEANKDPSLAAMQNADKAYEWAQLGLNVENMRHNLDLQWQSTMFNEVEDEKSEQLRELNVLRDVAMKQREADVAILKEFIRSIKD